MPNPHNSTSHPLQAYPEGPSQQGQNGRLCLHMALERSHPSEEIVRLLAHSYPAGVLMPSKPPNYAALTGRFVFSFQSVVICFLS